MDRRNFIGSMLALGAGFMILPPIEGGRIWKVEKKVITIPNLGIGSLWKTHYMSQEFDGFRPPEHLAKFGSVVDNDGALWYSTQSGWCQLKKMRRPLQWEPSEIYTPQWPRKWCPGGEDRTFFCKK